MLKITTKTVVKADKEMFDALQELRAKRLITFSEDLLLECQVKKPLIIRFLPQDEDGEQLLLLSPEAIYLGRVFRCTIASELVTDEWGFRGDEFEESDFEVWPELVSYGKPGYRARYIGPSETLPDDLLANCEYVEIPYTY